MSAKLFVDTNILLYSYDLDAGERHDNAKDLIARLWDEGTGVISTQVLQEFYINVTGKIPKPLPLSKARSIIRNYESWQVERISPETVISASEVQERYKISFWDAMIVAAAKQSGAEVLLTEDLNHKQFLAGVTVFNPFLESFEFPS